MDRLVEMVRLHRCGVPNRTAARFLHMGPNTHSAARRRFEQAGLWDGGTELPSQESLRALLPQQLPPQQKSSVEPWKELVRSMVERGLRARAIHTRLLLDLPAFSASYYAVKRLVVSLLCALPPDPDQVVIPVETGPGEVAQVDFAYVGLVLDPTTGLRKKAWFFLMTLGYSRHFFARVVFDQTIPTWLDLHVRAFTFFGGVPKTVVPDNLKSAIIRTSFGVDPDLEAQRDYRELARHYGFLIDPTPPRSPKKKGKVERNVAYVENFMASRAEDSTISELNLDLDRWNREIASLRIHGSTGRIPARVFEEERADLLPLPATPYLLTLWRHTRVQPDAHVLFAGRFYSLPWNNIGKEAWIQAIPDRVFLYVEDCLLAEHARHGPGLYSTLPGHLPERSAFAIRNPEIWRQRASLVGKGARTWVDLEFALQDGLSRLGRVQAVVLYLEQLPKDRAEAVCQRALTYGVHRVAEIKEIVVKGLDRHHEPEVGSHPPQKAHKFARSMHELTRSHQGGSDDWN